ncbi:MAG TPA: hypothetical protein GXZ47_03190, partial [Treponema sp.]|nr:hypothetical protein [Treponema sp.]
MKRRIIFIISSLFIFFLVFFLIHNDYQQRKIDHISKRLTVFDTRIEATSKTLSDFSRYVLEQSINQEPVLHLMSEAVDADTEERAIIRNKLYDLVSKDYELLLRYNFRQLHFQLPDNTSFLRMHSVEQFGDDLSDVRETIRRVNETLTPVIAYEEGRIYNGYRFVYPLIYNGIHCGSVEISFSMKS